MSGLPKETITVKNFGGMADVTIDLAPINIFIGPQGTGKSVCAKLIYFCRQVLLRARNVVTSKRSAEFISLKDLKTEMERVFVAYFPRDCWPVDPFEIQYEHPILRLQVLRPTKLSSRLQIEIESDDLGALLWAIESEFDAAISDGQEHHFYRAVQDQNKLLEAGLKYFGERHFGFQNQYYFPAERGFLLNSRPTYLDVTAKDNTTDLFLLEWAAFAWSIRDTVRNLREVDGLRTSIVDAYVPPILGARTEHDKDGNDVLVHPDGRRVRLEHASSGQQSTFLIGLGLSALDARLNSRSSNLAIFLEEPETHLYPNSQKQLLEIIVRFHKTYAQHLQLIITTHSPYVLTVLNGLLYAGQREVELGNGASEEVRKIVPPELILKPGTVNAFHFENGAVKSIMDPETGMILAEDLDQVSEDLSIQLGNLLEVE